MADLAKFEIMANHFQSIADGKIKSGADMDSWISVLKSKFNQGGSGNPIRAGELAELCGTTGCLLGTGVMLFDPTVEMIAERDCDGARYYFHFANLDRYSQDAEEYGADLFGIDLSEAAILFHSTEWSSSYFDKYEKEPAKTMAEICRRIANGASVDDVLADTGGW